MNENNIDKKILELMKDERFIQWKVFPNDDINSYWEKYLAENPLEKDIFEQANKHFPTVRLSSNNVSYERKKYVIDKLAKSLNQKRNKTTLRSIIFATAAACLMAAVMLTNVYTNKPTPSSESTIMGSEIAAIDIQLISNNKTTTFQENIEIEMDGHGEISIKDSDGKINEKTATEKQSINTLVIPFGKRSTILLADGSKVWLNSGTILEFPSSFTAKAREITLKTGEIYIEVADDKQKPFFVKTSDFNVRVYGTKFNVSSFEDKGTSVLLAEGSIAILKEGYKELLVEPTELIELTKDNTFIRQRVNINNYISWKSGYLLFDNTPIKEVLKQLEKYYNLSFDYEKEDFFKENSCKGKIVLSENLDNVLTTLSLLTKTEYKREGNKIFITNKKKK